MTLAIGLHNVPEGLAVATVLSARGIPPRQALWWTLATALPQPLVALPSFLFVDTFSALLPVALGFAAGCMIWMVFAELLPDALADASSHTQARRPARRARACTAARVGRPAHAKLPRRAGRDGGHVLGGLAGGAAHGARHAGAAGRHAGGAVPARRPPAAGAGGAADAGHPRPAGGCALAPLRRAHARDLAPPAILQALLRQPVVWRAPAGAAAAALAPSGPTALGAAAGLLATAAVAQLGPLLLLSGWARAPGTLCAAAGGALLVRQLWRHRGGHAEATRAAAADLESQAAGGGKALVGAGHECAVEVHSHSGRRAQRTRALPPCHDPGSVGALSRVAPAPAAGWQGRRRSWASAARCWPARRRAGRSCGTAAARCPRRRSARRAGGRRTRRRGRACAAPPRRPARRSPRWRC